MPDIPHPDQSRRHIYRIFLAPTNHGGTCAEYSSPRPIGLSLSVSVAAHLAVGGGGGSAGGDCGARGAGGAAARGGHGRE
eukprot:1484976-Pyramimonas_sp.AAC.1